MDFKQAQKFTMPFGKYKGKTLDDIASTDDGLLYLDWAYGDFQPGPIRDALTAYFSDPTIQKDLHAIARGRKGD